MTDRHPMNELDRLHQEAMELVDRAILCRRQGKPEAAIELLNAAFIQEKAAADLSALDLELNPVALSSIGVPLASRSNVMYFDRLKNSLVAPCPAILRLILQKNCAIY